MNSQKSMCFIRSKLRDVISSCKWPGEVVQMAFEAVESWGRSRRTHHTRTHKLIQT